MDVNFTCEMVGHYLLFFVEHYCADLCIIIIGMIIINRAIIREIIIRINVSELIISLQANAKDKKINTNKVNPMFIIDFNIVSELNAFIFYCLYRRCHP